MVGECSLAERGRLGFVSLDDTTYITKGDDTLDESLDDNLEEEKDGVTKGKARYELYLGLRNSDMVKSYADNTVQRFGMVINKVLWWCSYFSSSSSSLSSLLLSLYLLLHWRFLFFIFRMKNKTYSILINMAVEHLVGDGDDSKVGKIAGHGSKRIGLSELRSEVPINTVVASLTDIFVE